MKISELKEKIENADMLPSFMIFRYKVEHKEDFPDTFLIDQYINMICTKYKYQYTPITSLLEATGNTTSLLDDVDENLFVLKTAETVEKLDNVDQLKNTILVCGSIDKKIESSVSEYIIDFPKLLDWQVVDYGKLYCPGLADEDYALLFTASGNDIYRVLSELDKLLVFEQSARQSIFDKLKADPANDLFTVNIFTFTDSIVKRDLPVIHDYLLRWDYILPQLDQSFSRSKVNSFDDPAIRLSTLLLGNYKKIAYARSGLPASITGLTDKQVWAISKNAANKKESEVFNAIKFLSNIDLLLKDNKFDGTGLSNSTLTSYLISHLMAC